MIVLNLVAQNEDQQETVGNMETKKKKQLKRLSNITIQILNNQEDKCLSATIRLVGGYVQTIVGFFASIKRIHYLFNVCQNSKHSLGYKKMRILRFHSMIRRVVALGNI